MVEDGLRHVLKRVKSCANFSLIMRDEGAVAVGSSWACAEESDKNTLVD